MTNVWDDIIYNVQIKKADDLLNEIEFTINGKNKKYTYARRIPKRSIR